LEWDGVLLILKNKKIEQKAGNGFKKKPPTCAGGFLYKYKFN
jgi:hypothetical protein